MSLYISEQEMISRFADGLSQASSRAKEFLSAKEEEKPRLFIEFIAGLKIAAGSSHQLAHTQENPKFLDMRDLLEKIIEIGQELPLFGPKQNGLWLQIKKNLDALSENGQKMVARKSMKRIDVLAHLNHRQLQIGTDGNK